MAMSNESAAPPSSVTALPPTSSSTPPRRLRRTAQQWQALVDAQTHSGQSIKAFCQDQQIEPSGFYAWKRRLLKPAVRPTQSAGFVRLTTGSDMDADAVTITLPYGVELRTSPQSAIGLLEPLMQWDASC